MKAAIYCRVSTENQAREGTSLNSQREACLKKADELKYEVPEEFITLETYSGLTLDRTKLPRLRQWVRDRNVDAVIAYTLDRVSRNPNHIIILQEEMEKAGIELILVTDAVDNSDMGKLVTYIKGYAAKLEADKIRDRTMIAARVRAREGKIPIGGTGKLYGYTYMMGKEKGEGVRYINEEEAKWVREMFRWLIDEGLSSNAITYRLRALGVPTPGRSQFWRHSTVHEILHKPAYYGKTYVFTYTPAEITQAANPRPKRKKLIRKPVEEWVEIPGATPAIISQETFDLAQAKLEQNRKVPRRSPKRPYLLSGHIFCHRCGKRYRAKSVKPRRGGDVNYIPYYECPGGDRIVSPTKCRNQRWNANRLEELVWQQIEMLLNQPDAVLGSLETRMDGAKTEEANYVERELLDINRRLKALDEEQRGNLQQAKRGFPEEMVVADNKRINGDRAILEQRKIELETRIEQARETEVNMESIERFFEMQRQNLGEFTFENKRLALEALSIKVWVEGKDIEIEGAVKISRDDIQSITPRCSELEVNNSFPFSIPVLVR